MMGLSFLILAGELFCGKRARGAEEGGGSIERREGLPRAAASYRELPINCRKWGKGRVAVRYHAVTEIGRNG